MKYFSIALKYIGKRGIPKALLEDRIIKWSENNHDAFECYPFSTGEITKKNINSQSFTNYFEALIRFDLINEQAGLVLLSKNGAVLYEALKLLKESNSDDKYSISDVESFFYLNCIINKDFDLFVTVLMQLSNDPKMPISFYQLNFKAVYLEWLDSKRKLVQTQSDKVEINDVISRVTEWKSPKRYSEDIIPPRINWMADIGLIMVGSNNVFSLTNTGRALVRESQLFVNSEGWLSTSLCSFFAKVFFNESVRFWSDLDEKEKTYSIGKAIDLSLDAFKVLGILRLSVDQSFLFMQIYLLFKLSTVVETKQIGDWIGYEKIIGNKKIGLRKSARSYESYIIVSYAQ